MFASFDTRILSQFGVVLSKVDAVVVVRHRDVVSSIIQTLSYYLLNAHGVGAEPFVNSIIASIDNRKLKLWFDSLSGNDEEATEVRFRVVDRENKIQGYKVVVRLSDRSQKYVAEQYLIPPDPE